MFGALHVGLNKLFEVIVFIMTFIVIVPTESIDIDVRIKIRNTRPSKQSKNARNQK